MKKVVLISIIILAAFLRLYRLGDYPALNADEAAIGYNAYSLSETGKDEHGNPWPVHFQSFNDYKPGLYFYLVLPFVKFFGLNEWAVRFPSALFGTLTVLALYLLLKELGISRFPKIEKPVDPDILPLTASLFLAISPWHIHFSRGAWEVNVATFFITFGVWLFVKAQENLKFYVLSFFSFVLSLYTYHAARVVVPLLTIGLLFIYKDVIRKNITKFLAALAIAAVLLIPLALDLTKGSVFSRAAGVGLLADPGPVNRINEQRGEHENFRSLSATLPHNKAVNYALAFVDNWSEHFWGEFLFLSGDDIQRSKVPETGQMYLFDTLFLIAGLVAIAKGQKKWAVILLWLIVAPTAAALTFQSPHALRAQNMSVPLAVISAGGLIYLSFWLHRIVKKKILLDFLFVIFLALISWNFTRYIHMYFFHMAKEYPFSSQYGIKELVNYVGKNEGKYEQIVVTDAYDQPYILFLFYTNYPPDMFQKEHVLTPRDKYGFSTVRGFNKYLFEEINYDAARSRYPNSLIAGTDEEIPNKVNIEERIYGENGYLYFDVVAN